MALTHSPADIIRYLLIAKGAGTLLGANGSWPISAWQENDSPDNFITCYDTSGLKDGRVQNDGEVQEHPGVQIRVRSAIASDGNTKIRQIQDIVDKQVAYTTVVIASSNYIVHAISRPGTILSLGKETPTSKRALFTLNILVTITQVS